jgi:hypothetical protein
MASLNVYQCTLFIEAKHLIAGPLFQLAGLQTYYDYFFGKGSKSDYAILGRPLVIKSPLLYV